MGPTLQRSTWMPQSTRRGVSSVLRGMLCAAGWLACGLIGSLLSFGAGEASLWIDRSPLFLGLHAGVASFVTILIGWCLRELRGKSSASLSLAGVILLLVAMSYFAGYASMSLAAVSCPQHLDDVYMQLMTVHAGADEHWSDQARAVIESGGIRGQPLLPMNGERLLLRSFFHGSVRNGEFELLCTGLIPPYGASQEAAPRLMK